MKKLLTLLTALASLTIANVAHAGLGWTLNECKQHYGAFTAKAIPAASGGVMYYFTSKGFDIGAVIRDGTVSRVIYINKTASFDLAGAQALMESNAPETAWSDPEKDDADGSYRFKGIINGEIAYWAMVSSDGRALCVWTDADNDAVTGVSKENAKDL